MCTSDRDRYLRRPALRVLADDPGSREPLLGETPRAHNAGLGIGSRPGRRHLFLTDKADWTFFGRTNPMWRVRTHILCIHDKTEDGRSQRATSVSPMERF